MTKPTKTTGTDTSPKDARRRVQRLERRLAAVRELEQKRGKQAAKARDRADAAELHAKRSRQLERAQRRSAALEAELKALGHTGTGTVATAPGPEAWCLRERKRVAMVGAAPMTMRNGRAAVAGTCPSCGARVVRPA